MISLMNLHVVNVTDLVKHVVHLRIHLVHSVIMQMIIEYPDQITLVFVIRVFIY
jgi:hypothetical protein